MAVQKHVQKGSIIGIYMDPLVVNYAMGRPVARSMQYRLKKFHGNRSMGRPTIYLNPWSVHHAMGFPKKI